MPKDTMSKREILESLSRQLRTDLKPSVFVKVLTVYSKLSGWDTNNPSPQKRKVRS